MSFFYSLKFSHLVIIVGTLFAFSLMPLSPSFAQTDTDDEVTEETEPPTESEDTVEEEETEKESEAEEKEEEAPIKPQATLTINGQETVRVAPLEPILLELSFKDPVTQAAVKDFSIMHGKFMHMVVIKSDLSRFVHVHPIYDQPSGRFQIALHLQSQHPDNFATPYAIPEPGHYYVFAEVKSGHPALGGLMYRFDLYAEGEDVQNVLVADEVNDAGQIEKTFEDGAYKGVFELRKTFSEAGTNYRLFCQVLVRNEEGEYVPAEDLEKWLMMGGHSLIVNDGEHEMADTKTVFHKHHPRKAGPEGMLLFAMFDHDNQLPGGLYKTWIQFMHQGKVKTFPFVFNLK